ncbi:hypothetical protein G3480_08510 [Thiorhodococcus mannitoliphagus]|uniref:DUF6487 domain-containing protein n=1 Tax=Thiorhodococcus mannitoliphagus TaxID=329406 RepID=A0A6P1DPZ6_9GAMM|nr:PF20097 family protein [Thiorhodococcus mannitoliphagus]NEX20347.1 hypothetical protein [Thiorhodococcus mannitoliphagus]
MPSNLPIYLAALTAIGMLILLWVLTRYMQRKHRTLAFAPSLLEGRHYRCPDCGRDMRIGWVMLGRGAIWSPLDKGPPGSFAHIGSALPNTISMALKPASNLSWHCPDCQLLIVDHSTLISPPK